MFNSIKAALEAFERDLGYCICMEDRKAAVLRLSDKIGKTNANHVADMFNLKDGYYQVK
jgi:hypothetical protein